MTHKQVKFGKGKRSRKVKHAVEEYERGNESRRPILLSCDDVGRMAVESSRARLINNLISKSDDLYPREFASYLHGPTRYIDSPYSGTSHTSSGVSIPKIQQVIPAYPSFIQNPRWCSYSRPLSEQNSGTDVPMGQKYNCKCGNCTTRTCPAKLSNPGCYKDNIMTFCDRYTMTRNRNDSGCSHTSRMPSTPKCSNVRVPCTTSTVAARSAQDKVQVHEMYSRKGAPVPILKRCVPGPVHYECCRDTLMSDDFQDEDIRDIELSKLNPLKCPVESEDDCVSRKNIYNEGISDVIADKFPLGPKRAPAPADCSRTSMSSKCYECNDDNYIPHSHRSESKYHYHCKKPPECNYVPDASMQCTRRNIVIPSPKIICKGYASKPCRRCKLLPRCIKLPKKVLTSERVIESCMEKHSKDSVTCRRR